jgi:ABC-type uncharacterized transport system substrate-binding protein
MSQRLLLLWLLAWMPSTRALDIVVIAAQPYASVLEFVDQLTTVRAADQVRFMSSSTLPDLSQLNGDTRLILIGPHLLDWRQRSLAGPPSLVLQVSRVQARQILDKRHPPNITLLWSDPPVARQLNLIRELAPQARRIGVLYGIHSGFLVNELRQAAADHELQISAQFWPNSNDTRTLHRVLDQSDVLFGLDDAQLYNSSTIKTLLLSSYGRRIPLIGPTAAFIRAGSLASTYSDQEDWLKSINQLLDRNPPSWPASLYPESFQVMRNLQVGRSLGLSFGNKRALAKRLHQLENTP